VGVVGMAAFVAVVGVAMRVALQADKARRTSIALGACLAAVLGHLSETQLSFPVTVTATLFWLTLGATVAIGTGLDTTSEEKQQVTLRSLAHAWVYAPLAAAVMVVIVLTNGVPVWADVVFRQAQVDAHPLAGRITAAQRAVSLQPTQPVYRLHLAWLYLSRAQEAADPTLWLVKAVTEVEAAIVLTPTAPEPWAALGELYARWALIDPSRLAQADDAYRQAILLAPNYAILYTGWGLAHAWQGDYATAIAHYRRALELDATDAQAYRHLGDAYLASNMFKQAQEAYNAALKNKPNLGPALYGLGRTQAALGNCEEAIELYTQAVALMPGEATLYADLARCYIKLGKISAARQAVQEGLSRFPRHPDLLALWKELR